MIRIQQMTIEDAIKAVEDHTGRTGVTAETRLDSLGMDSLDFLELMVRLDIADQYVPLINTVQDLV